MTAVFVQLFNLGVTAGWMVLAVLLLRLCLKKAPRWITCVLWGLVALRLLVPFTIESPISLIPTAEMVVSSGADNDTSAPVVNSGVASIDKPLNDWLQTPVKPQGTPPVQSPLPPVTDTTPDVPEGDTNVTPQPPVVDTPTVPEEKPVDTEAKTVSRIERILNIAAPVWLVGIGLMLAYELVSVLRVRRRVWDAVLLRDNVWQSDRVSSPFIFGLFRPRIYVPYDLEEPMLEQVLSHERAHLHRRDHWIKPFAFTLLAVYWYNPLLWVAYILLCRDIEVACDERVVRGLDEEDRRQYATALLQCGVERHSIAACPLAFGEVSIKQRIKSVLNYRKPLLWVIIVSLVVCTVAAVCLLTVPQKGDEPVVLRSQQIQPDQVRKFYSSDTDGTLVEAGFNWLWEHAENPEAKTPDVDRWEETNIPLVVSRSKADLDALMDACSDDEWGDQVDMRYWFELEKYDDSYFEDQVIVWLYVSGYDAGDYDYVVYLEETNKGLRYAVTLDYASTSLFDPRPSHCGYLLLFETDRKMIEQAESLTTRNERAPVQLPTDEGLTMVPIGHADLDGDGAADDIRMYHSAFEKDGGYETAYLVVCTADGTPILREDILYYKYSQCYLVPQDDGSSLLLFIEDSGVGDSHYEEFGVLSLKTGERTVVQCRRDGVLYLSNLTLGSVISYVSSLSDWLEKAQLLYEYDDGSLYYGDTLGDTPRYTPLCWLDAYRTDTEDTLQEILENVLASLNGTVTSIGKMDFDEDGQVDSLFSLGYKNGSFDDFCLLVRDKNGAIITTIPIHTYFDSFDKITYLYRVTDSTGKEWLQELTWFMDGTCNVSDLSVEGTTNYRIMTMTEWLDYVAETGAKPICYWERAELYFINEISISGTEMKALQDYLNDPANNGFLRSYYSHYSEISLAPVFYDGAGVGTFGTNGWSEQEKKDVLAVTGWDAFHNSPLKITRADVNAVLNAKLDSNALSYIILDQMYAHFYYLSAYDAFYTMHGDTNQVPVTIKSVTRNAKGQYVVAYTADVGVYTTNCVVTLQETETGVAFVSNLREDTTTVTTILPLSYTPPASYAGKNVPDASGVPYSNVAPEDMTNQMAREILEVLIPRQREVFLLGNLDWHYVDETKNCSCSKRFARYTNEKIQSAQDVRNLVNRVYTGEAAEWELDHLLDGTLNVELEIAPRFHECEGVLYCSTYSEGRGLNEGERLWDATRIVWAHGDVVRVEMDYRYDETKAYDNVYTFTLCKTADGWRVRSMFLDISYTSGVTNGVIDTDPSSFVLAQNGYTYTVAEQDGSNTNAKTLSITDASGKVIQTIHFTDNEWFTKAPLYLIDANFDGYEDLIVPFQRPAHGGYFQAYIWDATAKQYRHAPTFERISNVALDTDSKMVLVRCTSDKITTHGMYRYDVKKQDFVVVRTLYWKPSDREGTMQVEESTYNTNGEAETMREFTVPAVNAIDVDESDARMAPYFAKGSLWDLDNNKWDVPLISHSQYAY